MPKARDLCRQIEQEIAELEQERDQLTTELAESSSVVRPILERQIERINQQLPRWRDQLRDCRQEFDFLSVAATRLSFPGAKVQGRRVIADPGFTFEEDSDGKTIFLRNNGGGTEAGITCECALEGGGCTPVILNPGDIDESAVCLPDGGCGSSGLFCFMDFAFSTGTTLRFRM
jgi:hypothetical protein